jgi:exopolyphosphatase/guanosine-5'-triphosphate,3'-diphosphate pyrophosphatase
MQRGLNAAAKFREEMNRLKPSTAIAFGTSAIRDASNGSTFSKILKRDYRIDLRIIDGNHEAELICHGVRHAVNLSGHRVLIMDIGGGSTEFIICDDKKIHWKKSYKLGSSFMLEHFSPSDPFSKSDIQRMESHFNQTLMDLFAACNKYNPQSLVGSAGSFETFASMIYRRHPEAGRHYGKKSHSFEYAMLISLCKDLVTSNREARKVMPGLLQMRIDMIVPASLLLHYVLRKTKLKNTWMSAYSLKEGALLTI